MYVRGCKFLKNYGNKQVLRNNFTNFAHSIDNPIFND